MNTSKLPATDPRLTNTTACTLNNFNQNFYVNTDEINSNDEEFINAWLMKWKKNQNILMLPVVKVKTWNYDFSISDAKITLRKGLIILKSLQSVQDELRCNVKEMSSDMWKQKTIEIRGLKDEFNKIMNIFDDPNLVKYLSFHIKKRMKKRKNIKNNKLFRKEIFDYEKLRSEEETRKIDEWIEEKEKEFLIVKQEEKFKEKNDLILAEVNRKKFEARKQLSLISSLVKLRAVRENMATQRGDNISLEDRKAFATVTESLIRLWENIHHEYLQEEQKLKALLESSNSSSINQVNEIDKEKEIVDEWKKILFGPPIDEQNCNSVYWALTNSERDIETFVAIRKSWDTFLTNSDKGTSIPITWLIPPSQPNDNWKQYLKYS